ncbi:hypothetical protein ACKWTF_014728 [Chironomus riparius]
MTKRLIELKRLVSSYKRQKMSESDDNMETEHSDQPPTIPLEMILKVISNLKSIEDIKNCMLLTKEINTSIFKTQEIMKNIKVQLKCFFESDTAKKVLTEHGRYIRCLSILAKVNSPKLFKDLLPLVPNMDEFLLERKIVLSKPTYPWSVVYSSWLSDLVYESDKDSSDEEDEDEDEDIDDDLYIPPPNKKLSDCWNDNEDSLDMIKLKALKIDVRDLEYFLKATKNVKNLEKLIIFSHGSTYDDFLFDFICQQKNLKELNVINQKNYYIAFPKEDPTTKVTFKLKKFKLLTTSNQELNENYTKFLAIHAESLEELEVDHSLSPQSLQIIFEKCHNLQKFTLRSDKNSELYSRSHPDWILPSIKHFDDQNSIGLNLDTVLKKFPNIESLKCQIINDPSRRPNKIKELEVNTMNAVSTDTFQFTDLKLITINQICFFREEIMRNTLINIKNVEHLVIRDARNTQILSRIFKHLDVMKKMKTFSFRVNPYTKRVYKMGDNEEVPKNYMFYKIMADMEKKVVKVSTFIVQQNKELFDILVETFKGFEFYEFCFDVTKMVKIDVEDKHAEC